MSCFLEFELHMKERNISWSNLTLPASNLTTRTILWKNLEFAKGVEYETIDDFQFIFNLWFHVQEYFVFATKLLLGFHVTVFLIKFAVEKYSSKYVRKKRGSPIPFFSLECLRHPTRMKTPDKIFILGFIGSITMCISWTTSGGGACKTEYNTGLLFLCISLATQYHAACYYILLIKQVVLSSTNSKIDTRTSVKTFLLSTGPGYTSIVAAALVSALQLQIPFVFGFRIVFACLTVSTFAIGLQVILFGRKAILVLLQASRKSKVEDRSDDSIKSRKRGSINSVYEPISSRRRSSLGSVDESKPGAPENDNRSWFSRIVQSVKHSASGPSQRDGEEIVLKSFDKATNSSKMASFNKIFKKISGSMDSNDRRSEKTIALAEVLFKLKLISFFLSGACITVGCFQVLVAVSGILHDNIAALAIVGYFLLMVVLFMFVGVILETFHMRSVNRKVRRRRSNLGMTAHMASQMHSHAPYGTSVAPTRHH